MPPEGDGEAGADPVIAAFDDGEGQLPLDDAFLYAAQHRGPEVHLEEGHGDKARVRAVGAYRHRGQSRRNKQPELPQSRSRPSPRQGCNI